MTTPKDTTLTGWRHLTVHQIEPIGGPDDLVSPGYFSDFAEIFPLRAPVEGDSAYAWFEPGEQKPIDYLTPKLAHALFEGLLVRRDQALDQLTGDDEWDELLDEHLPPGLSNGLNQYYHCGRYYDDLINGLLARLDYLLGSMANGFVPIPICTADEWLLHVSGWLVFTHWPFAINPLPDEWFRPSNQNLMPWDEQFEGMKEAPQFKNEFVFPFSDIEPEPDPDGGMRFEPLYLDSWFLAFFGHTCRTPENLERVETSKVVRVCWCVSGQSVACPVQH
jgi:hypothetical protein